jgi:hypothetical protein
MINGGKAKKIQRMKDKKSKQRQKSAKKKSVSTRAAGKLVRKDAKQKSKTRTKSYCGGGKRTVTAKAGKKKSQNPLSTFR